MLHAVILAGAADTQLRPESRGDRTMVQATVDRLGDLVPLERILVVTTEDLAGEIREQLSQLPRGSILCEPCPRSTAPSIGLAAIRILREDPDAQMAVLPADHVIEPPEAFRAAIRFAAALVDRRPRRLVTFGVRPTYPAEGFRYIERQSPLERVAAASPAEPLPAYRVKRFCEKPDAEAARQYLEAGGYYWSAGIFVWKARTILDALEQHEPQVFAHLQAIAEAADGPRFAEILEREFAAAKKTSIESAVLERAAEVVIVEAPFAWDDAGG